MKIIQQEHLVYSIKHSLLISFGKDYLIRSSEVLSCQFGPKISFDAEPSLLGMDNLG